MEVNQEQRFRSSSGNTHNMIHFRAAESQTSQSCRRIRNCRATKSRHWTTEWGPVTPAVSVRLQHFQDQGADSSSESSFRSRLIEASQQLLRTGECCIYCAGPILGDRRREGELMVKDSKHLTVLGLAHAFAAHRSSCYKFNSTLRAAAGKRIVHPALFPSFLDRILSLTKPRLWSASIISRGTTTILRQTRQ